ncbi:MAG: hypothetical protein M3077_00360 [Candidatus Dormibacteraeota bacterium]|nr:hypothetical protein [Candidatus Dormibacteraeota bacterium]
MVDPTTVMAIISSVVVFGAWLVLPHSSVTPTPKRAELPEMSEPTAVPATA